VHVEGRGSIAERWGQRLGLLLAVPALLVLFAAGTYAVGDAVLAPAPAPDHPGFVDTVLGSRAVVVAVRLAVISGGVFVVVSVVALIARGQWLTRVGPVHVSDVDNQRLLVSIEHVRETIDNLEQDLAKSNLEIERMREAAKGVQ
jgi:hypothetical protein